MTAGSQCGAGVCGGGAGGGFEVDEVEVRGGTTSTINLARSAVFLHITIVGLLCNAIVSSQRVDRGESDGFDHGTTGG